MDGVFAWVSTYGYGAIILLLFLGVAGLPITDETIMVFTGYLISQGRLRPIPAFLCALAGSWSGISVSYTIGRTLGVEVVHRYGRYIHLTEERLDKVHQWFAKICHWALFVGYYIIGVRHLTAIVAGMSKLEFRSFMLYAWSGGALWCASFITIGYFLGENWRQIAEMIHTYLLYASIAIVVLAAAVYLWRRRSGVSKA